jgi:hypothetical protein
MKKKIFNWYLQKKDLSQLTNNILGFFTPKIVTKLLVHGSGGQKALDPKYLSATTLLKKRVSAAHGRESRPNLLVYLLYGTGICREHVGVAKIF